MYVPLFPPYYYRTDIILKVRKAYLHTLLLLVLVWYLPEHVIVILHIIVSKQLINFI